MSSTTLVVVDVGLITVTVQWTSTRLVIRKSVDDTHGIACSIVVPSTTIRVQK